MSSVLVSCLCPKEVLSSWSLGLKVIVILLVQGLISHFWVCLSGSEEISLALLVQSAFTGPEQIAGPLVAIVVVALPRPEQVAALTVPDLRRVPPGPEQVVVT